MLKTVYTALVNSGRPRVVPTIQYSERTSRAEGVLSEEFIAVELVTLLYRWINSPAINQLSKEKLMSSRKAILNYVAKEFDVQPDYPWDKFPDYAILRHADSEKWFGIVMNVPKEKLGLSGEGELDILDVKCHPDKVSSVRQIEGILPGYHMNKEHWISVVLDGSVALEQTHELIQDSYEITK